jgi:NAD-dependent dihydropyrimidine dehydrogenase PreA subunit
MIGLMVVLTILGGIGGRALAPVLSRAHWKVQLAERLEQQEAGNVQAASTAAQEKFLTDAADAFRETGEPVSVMYAQASNVLAEFRTGAMLAGGFIGLVLGSQLVRLAVRRRREDYEADRSLCIGCGRCFARCPIEQRRRREKRGEKIPQ